MILSKDQYNEIQKEAVNRAIVYAKQTGRIVSPYPYLFELLTGYDNVTFAEGIAQNIRFKNGEIFIPVISPDMMQKLAAEISKNKPLLNGFLGELEGPYIPTEFQCNSLDTIIPDSMDYETHISMRKIKEKVGGSLNQYLARKLNYTDEQLCKALGAEQIEAAAVAIYNIEEKNQGVIVGDQTGVGKGRVAAVIIKYAIENGKTPMFFTKDAGLFSDIYRDLIDIGADDGLPETHSDWGKTKNPIYNRVNPFIVNALGSKKNELIKDENGTIIYRPLPKSDQDHIIKSGKLPSEYDVVLCTYSQINSPKQAKNKINFTINIAKRDCILILDESHMAGGDNPGKGIDNKPNKSGLSNTGDHVLNMIREAIGAVFLSATFAKRPGNMPIYAEKTCIKDAGMTNIKLVNAFKKGGVALQEVVSSQLVAEGQMVRRQRTFENIKVEYKVLEEKTLEHRAISDNITGILRDIIAFQRDHISDYVSDLDTAFQNQHGSVEITKGTKKAGLSNDPYFSRVFQVTNQLLFSIKAADAALHAITRLKEGYSVVIALANTMESFLKDFVDESDTQFKEGDVINVDFSNALLRGLRSVMKITEKDAFGKSKLLRYIEPSELSAQGQAEYYRIVNKIKNNSSGITVSPIDMIHKILQDAGYKTLEVTGRSIQVNFIDPKSRKKQNLNGLGMPEYQTVDDFIKEHKGHVFVKKPTVDGFGAVNPDHISNYPEKIKIENKGNKAGFVVVTSPSDPTYRNEIEIDSILKYYIPQLNISDQISLDSFNYGTISTQTNKKNKTDSFRLFNENKVDVLIINQSGSTGASAHAKPIKNKKTGQWIVPPEKVKPRCGIIVQAELDVSEEVQKRGRINRTGQKYPPIYDYIFSDIPAEKRFMMMLKSKLKSLDANTASDQGNSEELFKSDDFLNKYGDVVATNFLKENVEYVNILGDPLDFHGNNNEKKPKEDAAKKITGRANILPCEQQEKVYTEIKEAYLDYLTYLDSMGENDLIVTDMKLDATVIDRQIIEPGNNEKSVFAQSVFLDTCEVNNLRKPFTKDELSNLLSNAVSEMTSDEQSEYYLSEFKKRQAERYAQQIENYKKRTADEIRDITSTKKFLSLEPENQQKYYTDKKNDLERLLEKQLIKYQQQNESIISHVTPLFENFKIGEAIKWPKIISSDGSGNMDVLGVFLGWKIDMKAQNPFAPSKIKLDFAVADSTKRLSLVGSGETYNTLTQIMASSRQINPFDSQRVIDRWDVLITDASSDRVQRHIITGNIMKGIESTAGKGRLISYTMSDGGTKKGILMPESWSPEKEKEGKGNDIPLRIGKAGEVLANMSYGTQYNTNKLILIQQGYNEGDLKILTEGPKVETHKWLIKNKDVVDLASDWEGFTKINNRWIGRFPARSVPQLLEILDQQGVLIMVSRAVYEHYFGEIDTSDVKIKDEITIEAERQFESDKARFLEMQSKTQTFSPIVELGVQLKSKSNGLSGVKADTKPLKDDLKQILGIDKLQLKQRFVKTQIGEVHHKAVALYGEFAFSYKGEIFPKDIDSLAYHDQSYEFIDKLKQNGYNAAIKHLSRHGKMEIVIEVNSYSMEDDGQIIIRKCEKNYLDWDEVGNSHKAYYYKLVKRF